MCKSKWEGGMDFRDLHAFNLAMLAKQGWRMLVDPCSLMARLYKAKYFPNSDVLSAKIGSNPSYAWRSIHQSLEVLRQDTDTKRWRRDRLENILLPFEVETILNIPISYHLPEDSIIWLGNKKGSFLVKSAYYVAKRILEKEDHGESSLGDVCASLWKRMWHLNIPGKIRIFAWRLCMNAIPTLTNLFKKGIQMDVTCPICKKDPETVEHAIISVSAKAVNQVVNENGGVVAELVWGLAIRLIEDFKEANIQIIEKKGTKDRAWKPPPKDVYLINVDGAIPAKEGNSGIGVIIRDWNNQVVAALSKPLSGRFAVEETEAIAMEQGIVLAKELGLNQIILEGDSMQTVQAICNKDVWGVAGHIIHGILEGMNGFIYAEARYICRNSNKIAHELAQQDKRSGEECKWFDEVPENLASLCRLDGI
ncbi:uncharacterized protein LOC115956517 [Quercus lobata]|uniref:uncharacterized protein LOC115956517 n=1 Tax=Quercus lobata TaxID=97700 RepID=UPI001248887F|nr:uncharacterized protein LOC115956517 [Quercus lobata]